MTLAGKKQLRRVRDSTVYEDPGNPFTDDEDEIVSLPSVSESPSSNGLVLKDTRSHGRLEVPQRVSSRSGILHATLEDSSIESNARTATATPGHSAPRHTQFYGFYDDVLHDYTAKR